MHVSFVQSAAVNTISTRTRSTQTARSIATMYRVRISSLRRSVYPARKRGVLEGRCLGMFVCPRHSRSYRWNPNHTSELKKSLFVPPMPYGRQVTYTRLREMWMMSHFPTMGATAACCCRCSVVSRLTPMLCRICCVVSWATRAPCKSVCVLHTIK